MSESVIPRRLIEELAKGLVVPFIGSGVSLDIQRGLFPTWGQLLEQMATKLDDEQKPKVAKKVRQYCEIPDMMNAAKVALDGLGQHDFFDTLRHRLQLPKPQDADANWSLPNAIWNLKPSLIVTLNYDNVLSWSNPDSRQLLNDQPEEMAILTRSANTQQPWVWHLHGHISRAKSLILAPSQYDQFYEAAQAKSEYEAARLQLKGLISNRTLLFIGFGLRDEYVMQLLFDLFQTFERSAAPHYALLKKGESDEFKQRLETEFNIRVIDYDDHGPPLVALLEKLATSKPAAISENTAPSPERLSVPDDYKIWLSKQCLQNIELSGMRPKHGRSVTLRNVYVPLVTARPKPDRSPADFPGGTLGRPEESKVTYQLLQSLVAQTSFLLAGGPGTGKTTFCRWLALSVCQGELQDHPIEADEEFREVFPESLRGDLPLLIRLREFFDLVPHQAEVTREQFETSLELWFQRKKYDGLSWPVFRKFLTAGRVLLIFDGVDEVPRDRRSPLLSGLSSALESWKTAGNRIVITSRQYGLTDAQVQALGLPNVPLARLPDELQKLLVQRWFGILRPDPVTADQECQKLWRDVRIRPDIQELASNPLLLTAICIVYDEDHKLPQHEFDLYDRIVNTVLENRYPGQVAEAAAVRSSLCVIAHGMHTGESLGESRRQPLFKATNDEIERMLQVYLDKRPGSAPSKRESAETRDELLSKSGLLLPQADDSAGFYHATIQDFLAAERLFDLHIGHIDPIFNKFGESPEWRKGLGLLFGSLLHKLSTPDQALSLLSDQIRKLDGNHYCHGVLLGDCIRILYGRKLQLSDDDQQCFVDICLQALSAPAPLKERVELALALGRLGDPRVATDLKDPRQWIGNPSTWVTVPAGDYKIGDAAIIKEWSAGWAFEPTTVNLPAAIQLSRYPVTNQQYAAFIKAGGYTKEEYWDAAGWAWRVEQAVHEPAYWNDARWNGATCPVVGVSWYEAVAYCQWAGCRLPTEREWESAARGPDGMTYPWGRDWKDGICNTSEADLGVTTPVGIFNESRSFCGADDLAGNVWEWCDDWFDSEKQVFRVLRGGSWNYGSRDARSAIRSGLAPDYRYYDLGFRVVCCVRTS